MSDVATPLPGSAPAEPSGGRPRWQADLMLVVAAFFFGSTFLVVQDAVTKVDAIPFLGMRFSIAALVIAPVALRRARTDGELRDGIVAGLSLLAGYICQTTGLQYTSSSTSAFITYMLVVIVPVMSIAVHRRAPTSSTAAGVVLAVIGLVLLTGGGEGATFGKGEALTVLCAAFFALHIVILGRVVSRHDPIRLTAIQAATVGIGCGLPGFFVGGYGFPAAAVGGAAFTGIFATAIAFFLMAAAQRTVSPTRTALVLLLEPVFAAVLGYLDGERLGATGFAGAGLILVAVVVSEVTWRPLDVGADQGK